MQIKNLFSGIPALLLTCAFFFISQPAFAAESSHAMEGGALSIWWIIPFVGILFSIAVFPLVTPDFWHHHFGKISAFWAACIIIPMILFFGFDATLYEVLHTFLLEYFPFIVLLFALFTISGGIRISGYLKGTPEINTLILLAGTLLASWIGTTGAAMLFIRPLLRANQDRKEKVHIVIFFIFLVANVGGALTPLGDPPLFIGFLQGVDFFWTTTHLFLPMSFIVIMLLAVFYIWDRYLYTKEGHSHAINSDEKEPLAIEGSFNFLLMAGVIAAVLFSGTIHIGDTSMYGVPLKIQNIFRDMVLLLASWISWMVTPKKSRAANGFDWFPMQEVAKIFAGIFITIIAPILMLKAANTGEGPLQGLAGLLFTSSGSPNNEMFFWITGTLSALLDNTPTYLVFFNAAGGNAMQLMHEFTHTLEAISAGAVFFGAMTYIGNAPNFMVKSISEKSGVKMPGFGGYLLWSVGILIPVFLLAAWIFPSF